MNAYVIVAHRDRDLVGSCDHRDRHADHGTDADRGGHGAGPGPGAWHRQEAEAFAAAGIVGMIYDKRTEGYSLTERSFSQLADDALGAVEVLPMQERVDPARVGCEV